MQELVATARNIRMYLPENDKERIVKPEIEVVLTTIEPNLEFFGMNLNKVEKTNTIRFVVTPDAARQLANSLEEWATAAADRAEEIKEGLEKLKDE